MSSVWVLPKDIINDIDEMADRLKEAAFPHNGRLHYYSGPSDDVWGLITGGFQEKNHPRALEWAKKHGAMVIDVSPVGEFLLNYAGVGTFEYFKNHPHLTRSEIVEARIAPWKHASHLLALSAYGHVTTTVCGADRSGVYYSIELQNTLAPTYHGLSAKEFLAALSTPRKKEVETINLIPFTQILDARDKNGVEAANTKIQLGEIRMALQEALENAEPEAVRKALKCASQEVLRSPADAYKYFLESQERFVVDRAVQMKGTPAYDDFMKNKSPVARQQHREERLDQFASKVLLLIETEIALMPLSSRPDFIVPAYLKHVMPK